MSREKKDARKDKKERVDMDKAFEQVQINTMVCIHDIEILLASIYEAVEELGVKNLIAMSRDTPDKLARGIGLYTWYDMRDIAIGVGMSMNAIATNDPVKGARHFIESGKGGMEYVKKGIRDNIRSLYVRKAKSRIPKG